MQGKRIKAEDNPGFAPGEYGIVSDGTWYACTPSGHLSNLRNHEVVQHEDGTITVSPSILVEEQIDGVWREAWHGYLEAGVWREV